MTSDTDTFSTGAFFARTREARLAEADRIWAELVAHGHAENLPLLADFTFYGRDPAAGEAMAAHLVDTYAARLSEFEPGGWMLVGTTRPFGTRFSEAKLREWIAFLCDLGASHGFVFSLWAVTMPGSGLVFGSEAFTPPAAG